MDDLPRFNLSLQTALSEQFSDQYDEIRNECMTHLNEKVEARIKALDAENNVIITQEVAQKAELLAKRFNDLLKQYTVAVDSRRIMENASKSARMRYDKLNVRLMNSGLRVQQLGPKTQQINLRSMPERFIQTSTQYSNAVMEVREFVDRIKQLQEERDEYKAKIELAHSENSELNASLESAKLKLLREAENFAKCEIALGELQKAKYEQSNELNELKEKLVGLETVNGNLRLQIAELEVNIKNYKNVTEV